MLIKIPVRVMVGSGWEERLLDVRAESLDALGRTLSSGEDPVLEAASHEVAELQDRLDAVTAAFEKCAKERDDLVARLQAIGGLLTP